MRVRGDCCIFLPDGGFRMVWDLLQVVALSWVAISIPFNACFAVVVETFSPNFVWEMIVDVCSPLPT
jgi:hypothetical protein